MVWKADSTFDASNADVSMKERLFSAAASVRQADTGSRDARTCERLRLVGGYGAQVLQIALIADEHDDDV